MPEKSKPRSGSLGYRPKGRAKSLVPTISSWPEEGEPQALGFPTYKAGMTHLIMVENEPGSLKEGQEVSNAVTILEAPPVKVCAVRAYEDTLEGKEVLTEAWSGDLHRDLKRRIKTLPDEIDHEDKLSEIEEKLDKIVEIRLLVHTQPELAGVKKKPDVMEYKLGGTVEAAFEYAREILGKDLRVSDVHEPGEMIDVKGVTKGKGFEGIVKRHGVRILNRKARNVGKGRHIGSMGPWHPRNVMWTVPMGGQMGFHTRTELNKKIIDLGEDGDRVTPEGGFTKYGEVEDDYIILKGSVPGPKKRLVRTRKAIRPPEKATEEEPEIVHISTQSDQGV